MLKIIEISKNNLTEDYIKFLEENQASFLQDLAWGEFQAATGKKVWNLGVIENSTFLAVAQIVEHQLPFGKSYLYCPRGPTFNFEFSILNQPSISKFTNEKLKETLKLLIDYFKNLAKKEKAIFFRIEPEFLINDQGKIEIIKDLKFRKSIHELQPKDSLVLDLSKTKEGLLKEMHYKTRYNIRLAEKRGVKVRQSVNQKDIEIFYRLLKKTAARDEFSPHKFEYYQKQLEILGPKNLQKLFLAGYQRKIIAGILVSFYNNKAIYMHGAYDENFRNLMAPHLLQWQAILEAKKRGCIIYDFWGIAPSDASKNHPWQGITRFKRGFGGREINYVGAWDFVFLPIWYFGYNVIHKFKN